MFGKIFITKKYKINLKFILAVEGNHSTWRKPVHEAYKLHSQVTGG